MDPLILGLGTSWRCVHLHAPAALPRCKRPGYPLGRWLSGDRKKYGRHEGEKTLPAPGFELRPLGRPALS
jgi:hypothetical protein